MTERTSRILRAALEMYINTGVPVTSSLLYHDYDFGIKPAMIRWALRELTDEGYLLQEHTSAGRIPTDKGYRYFTDVITAELDGNSLRSLSLSREREWISRLFDNDEYEVLNNEFSERLNVLNVLYQSESGRFFERGLCGLCESLLYEASESLPSVIRDFELLRGRLEDESLWVDDVWPKVFVGGSPVIQSNDVSVIANKLESDGDAVYFIAIGPKRMNYRKSITFYRLLMNN